jgi:rhodanese-related sulfurtransferase
MAPLIPQGIINPELNFFFALILGIGFGYVLEQAGFSSSRKLAGVFYGYDFVVLRVFFTAGITAMTGLMFFGYLGWIDLSLVYVNPTFLYSAILGGAIMGFGFILGGYCPGTSFVGAVIGKVDAMVFIIGSLIGIFIFGHFYDAFEPIYTGSFLGNLLIYDSLGISKAWFALIMIVVALLAFAITQKIEDRVNNIGSEAVSLRPSYRLPAMLLVTAAVVFLFLPAERKSRINEAAPEAILEQLMNESDFVNTHRVIHQIKNQNDNLILIDARSSEEYAHFTLPGAIHIPMEDILMRGWLSLFEKDYRMKVFFSNGNTDAMQAYLTAKRAGFENIFVMDGGLNKMFKELFIDYDDEKTESYNLQERSTARFLRDARIFFLEGGAAAKDETDRPMITAPEESEVIPVIGGC